MSRKQVDLTHFERYKPLLDDWAAFSEICFARLPACLWTNTLRTTPTRLREHLAEAMPLEPLDWYPSAFKLPIEAKPGTHWAFLAGLYHVQEEVSLIPVLFLDPQPGERVLDMCAAPGNKSAQIATLMQNRGTVIANDRSYGRMRGSRQTFERLGLVNITTTTEDAANLPKDVGAFDKILVDVPCSCEGTSRKTPSIVRRASVGNSLKLQGLQKALLRKAVQLCNDGGRIVYATCTYAPEENEAVVDAILKEAGEDVRLLDARLPQFEAAPGITHWQGETFDPTLAKAMRVWPHHNDTGGFFIAVLEKRAPAVAEPVPTLEASLANLGEIIERDMWLAILSERFGIAPTRFEEYQFFQPNPDHFYLINRDHAPFIAPQPDAIGLKFMKATTRYPKLTTAAVLAFGHWATRHVIDLTAEQMAAFYTRTDIDIAAAQTHRCEEGGFVIVRYQGEVLGVASLRLADSGGGVMSSLFPKAWARNFSA